MYASIQKIFPKSKGGGGVRGIDCFPMPMEGGGLKAWFPQLNNVNFIEKIKGGGVDRRQIRASNEDFRLEQNQKAIQAWRT